MAKKTEDTNELPRSTGTCKHCGQPRIIQTIGDITQEQADEIATSECDCDGAKKERERERMIEQAEEWIDGRFENKPYVKPVFFCAVKSVVSHEIKEASIKEGEWTHKIALNSDGYVVIKSSKNVNEEVSFS